ncbi:MAG: UDP-3-O-acyl-N-acetylglucosamine deacetylase [Deltaproteobacteria bacterium]|nr:UDP-3-O-acyl-N-acetylglucosamine deacetylase [Deltaproteobacteria bacterium]
MKQSTIKLPITFDGVGLHSGVKNKIKITPAPANTGIIFKFKNDTITARYSNSCDSILSSALSNGRSKLYTVEHLLASLYALKIDNVMIESEENEIPILDGSAILFAKEIVSSGIRFLDAPKRMMIIKKEVSFKINDSYAIVRPADSFLIKYTIDFKSRLIGKQSHFININPKSFIEEIAPARTFCEYRDVERLQSLGLIKGGNLDNAIVVDDTRLLNDKPLRFINEFVRHKILDAIGDISLLGYDVLGEFEFYKAGHNINRRFVGNILSDKSNYEIVDTIDYKLEEEEDYLLALAKIPELTTSK